jgi:hypothetical protein
MPKTTVKCTQCPAPADPKTGICIHCSIELVHRIMAAEPDACSIPCAVCEAPISYTEARVLRYAKNPTKGNQQTPKLCWVCAHLHLSANRAEPIPLLS